MKEDNMTKSKIETKSKAKIIFEKLTVEEEKKVRGSATPDGYCGPALDACGLAGPPSLMEC
jgi:hypothetical protein